jgi:hypothetical protein
MSLEKVLKLVTRDDVSICAQLILQRLQRLLNRLISILKDIAGAVFTQQPIEGDQS